MTLSHEMMMNLAAFTAGVDRPAGTRAETLRLYELLMLFIQGATLAHYTGDREAKRAEVAAGLAAFDDEFLAASLARRRAAIDEVARGTLSEDALPHDVLTTLLRHDDELHLAPDVVLREICFFLLAGAHTSATAFVRTLHHVFELAASSPADASGSAPTRCSCSAACTRPSGCSPRARSRCGGRSRTSSCPAG